MSYSIDGHYTENIIENFFMGDPGPPGPPGGPGRPGHPGPPGPAGPNNGPVGPIGPVGLKGDKGDKGDTGEQGVKGNQGDAGNDGKMSILKIEGPIGPQGAPGPSGSLGIQGPPGKRGFQGPPGIPGLPGEKGNDGSIGPIGSKGDRGLPGQDGMMGPNGQRGQRGLPGSPGKDAESLVSLAGNTSEHSAKLNILRNIFTPGLKFYDDKIGVGLDRPKSNLHISSGENKKSEISISESEQWGDAKIKFQPASVNYMSMGFSKGQHSSAQNNIEDGIAITRLGNVGIGTNQPDYKLHVKGEIRSDRYISAGEPSSFSGITNTGNFKNTGNVNIDNNLTSSGTIIANNFKLQDGSSIDSNSSTNDITFKKNGTNWRHRSGGDAAIVNADDYNTLMIVGRGEGERRIGMWDKVNINGKLEVSGDLTTNNIKINKPNKLIFSGNDNDPYYLQKIVNTDSNHLRLTINDNSNESLQIWGNSCGTTGCGGTGVMQHKFDAAGNASHKGNVTAESKLCIGKTCVTENDLKKILLCQGGVCDGKLVHERQVYGLSGQNAVSYSSSYKHICSVYSPFGYAIPGKSSGAKRKFRLRAIYTDDMTRSGEHHIRFCCGSWGSCSKNVTFKLGRTWGTTSESSTTWNRDVYSNWISESDVSGAHHTKIYCKTSYSTGVIRSLILETWDFV